ncbi:MAG: Rcs stress response system protein RcsF [Succinivibrio sp.]|jgi:RcsF protein|nr:Rcs stress response system protein RcsF [Succinivibrio sp.]
MKKIALVFAAFALAGCSGYSVHTNLDPDNFREYFKPSGAQSVTDEDLQGRAYKVIGQVTGLSCKAGEYDPAPTEADARTKARLKAVDLGANAVKFGRCVRLENTPACLVSVTCYGDALVVQE